MLLGVIWMITPNFSSEVIDFVKDFHLENLTENIALPAPQHNHPVVYTAAMEFCLIFGAFQVVILALRCIYQESLNRKSGTISSMAFWLSTSLFLNLFANEATGWFGFLAGLVISAGLAIVISSAAKLFR
jgi:hypothetical protein